MTPFTLHCGTCGRPAVACACPPIAPPPVLPPRTKFGGYLICTVCRMADAYCACARQAAPEVASTDGAESNLERRIRALKGTP